MNRLLYRRVQMCFACGAAVKRPCAGHEYGGMIYAWQARRWTHRWLTLTSASYRQAEARHRAEQALFEACAAVTRRIDATLTARRDRGAR